MSYILRKENNDIYTGEEAKKIFNHTENPPYFGYVNNTDNPDVITVAVQDQWQVFLPNVANYTVFNSGHFSYDPITGIITPLVDVFLDLTGSTSGGVVGNPANQFIHFGVFIDGVLAVQSEVKLESSTDETTLALTSLIDPMPVPAGAEITVRVKSTQSAGSTFEVNHTEGRLLCLKPNLA